MPAEPVPHRASGAEVSAPPASKTGIPRPGAGSQSAERAASDGGDKPARAATETPPHSDATGTMPQETGVHEIAEDLRFDTGSSDMNAGITPYEKVADVASAVDGTDAMIAIDFTAAGNSREYLTHGWLQAEADFTWTDGDESGLRVTLPDRISGCRCAVSVARLHVGDQSGLSMQIVYVLANTIFVDKFVLERPTNFEFVVPQSACRPGASLDITFLLPNALHMGQAPAADDDRRPALGISRVAIFNHPSEWDRLPVDEEWDRLPADTQTPDAPEADSPRVLPETLPLQAGDPAAILELSFASTGNVEPYLGDGWSDAEDELTWTEDDDSVVYVPRPTGAGPFLLRLSFGACTAPKIPRQRLEVYLNDSRIGALDVDEDGPEECEFVLEASAFGGLSIATLRLHHPDALRPSDHFDSDDTRRLAFAFRSIALLNAA